MAFWPSYLILLLSSREADELESEKGEEEMSENMSPDGGMVCTADDGVDLGVGDQRGTFEMPTDWGDDETTEPNFENEPTGEWEEAPTGEWEPPNVSVDWESEPTLTDAPAFPEVESGATEAAETGAITSETAEGGVAAGEIMTEAAEAGVTAGEVAEGVTAGEVILDVLEVGALLL
jgi:hypothetical protein